LGIVEMLAGGLAHDAMPATEVLPDKLARLDLFTMSSLPRLVSLLVAGEVDD
jgi:hypothetical protein